MVYDITSYVYGGENGRDKWSVANIIFVNEGPQRDVLFIWVTLG